MLLNKTIIVKNKNKNKIKTSTQTWNNSKKIKQGSMPFRGGGLAF